MSMTTHSTVLGIAMVKNEQDVIEPFVRHNLRFLDHLVVVDNGSVDETRAILLQLADEFSNLLLVEDDQFGYNQSERMTRWLAEYQEMFSANYIFALDADEFLRVEENMTFKDVLRAIPTGGYGLAPWCTYVITPDLEQATEKDPLRAIHSRRRRELPPRYKAIIRLDGQPAADLILAQGNHSVRSHSGRQIEATRLTGLEILHYPLRSMDQAAAKNVVGWMAYLVLDPRVGETKHGHGWRAGCDRFVSGHPVRHIDLCDMSLLYTQDPRTVDWTADVVAEPSRLMYERRYSTGEALGAMQLVARSWEQSLTGSRRHSPSLKIAAMAKGHCCAQSEPEAARPAEELAPVPKQQGDGDVLTRLLAQGCSHEAIAYLEAKLHEGQTAELWNDLATVQYGAGKATEAENGYRRALELEPAHRQAGVNLGLMLLAQGRFDAGVQLLNPHAGTLTPEEKRAIGDLLASFRAEAGQSQSNPAVACPTDEVPKYGVSTLRKGKRRNLIVVRAGEDSLHPTWLAGAPDRNWDLLVYSYGEKCPWSSGEGVEIIRAVGTDIQGPKMRAMHSLYQDRAEFFAWYDHVCFADDDLASDAQTFNLMFVMCEHYGLELAQPALTHDSYMGAWSITMENRSFLLRYTNFVEVMCPVFSRKFLKQCAPTFNDNVSGYGLDLLWSSWVSSPWKIAILDACPVKHTRVSFSGQLYKTLAAMGVNPDQELIEFIKRWHLVKEKDQIPGQVVVPTSTNVGGVLRDQTRLTVQDGQGLELLRALLNGLPKELMVDHARVIRLLFPLFHLTLARYEHGDPDPDRPEIEKSRPASTVSSKTGNRSHSGQQNSQADRQLAGART